MQVNLNKRRFKKGSYTLSLASFLFFTQRLQFTRLLYYTSYSSILTIIYAIRLKIIIIVRSSVFNLLISMVYKVVWNSIISRFCSYLFRSNSRVRKYRSYSLLKHTFVLYKQFCNARNIVVRTNICQQIHL